MRKDSATMIRTLLTISLLLLPFSGGTPAEAAVLQVANNGLDGPACGSKTAPCRSITRAIDLAAAGDTIVVGPGRYGDLDRDGTLGEANEEGPEAGAVIVIDKAVAVESSTGAVWTIIDVAGFNRLGVRITANGARFGRAKKGFTIFDSSSNGVSIEGSATGVVVEGNHAILTNSAFLAGGTGGGHVIQGNVASANALGFGLASAGGAVARSNLAVASSGDGFATGGTGTQRFEGNVALANDFGFSAALYDEAVLVGNVAVGNREGLRGGNGATLTATGFAAIANRQAGVHNQGTTSMSLTASNLIGNGTQPIGGSANCGSITETPPLTASNVFWGAATGPGDDPADDVCDVGVGVTTVAPVAAKPFKIKTKAPSF